MIIVHHLNNSRSQRVLWLLEELNLPYEIKRYERDPKTIRAPKSLRDVHPLGKSPVITDGDITVAESGAIIDYLVRTYAKDTLCPNESSAEFRDYLYWMHFSEGSLMPPLLMRMLFEKVKSSPMPFFIKPVAKMIADKVLTTFVNPEITLNMSFVDQYLSTHTWFAGENLSGADFQMSFPLEASVAAGAIVNKYPNIHAYVKRFQECDTYLKALEKGGDYDYGPKK
jgi:glutathione S-transferase